MWVNFELNEDSIYYKKRVIFYSSPDSFVHKVTTLSFEAHEVNGGALILYRPFNVI